MTESTKSRHSFQAKVSQVLALLTGGAVPVAFLLAVLAWGCSDDDADPDAAVVDSAVRDGEGAPDATTSDATTTSDASALDATTADVPGDGAPADAERADATSGPLVAFPGAAGFGQNATGGRGGFVYEVTNLNDSGEGSLRDGVMLTGARTIVFKVSGTITLENVIGIEPGHGDLTIAGQTAPGQGITLFNNQLTVTTSNVIIRNLRVRRGNGFTGNPQDAFRIVSWTEVPTTDVIVDHCTFSWPVDESVDTGSAGRGTGGVDGITVQNSMIGPTGRGTYGWLLSGGNIRTSSYRNFFVGNRERNPTVQSPAGLEEIQTEIRAECINNVVYDYLNGMTLGYGLRAAYIGNVFKDYTGQAVGPVADDVYEMTTAGEDGDMRPLTQFYGLDNRLENAHPIRNLYHSSVEEYRVDVPTESSGSLILPSAEVSATVVGNAGALPLDAYDQSLVDAFRASTNPRNDETLPTLAPGTPYTDEDHDGMEDDWERASFGDLGRDGAGDDDADGYTDLEEFLASLY